jgi:hypothetical protein
MNTQIDFLSDDALNAVSGGRPNIISEGHVAIAGSSTATGTQIGGGGGTSNSSTDMLGEFLAGVGVVIIVAAAAALGKAGQI